jgi:hypothetical protein
MPSKSPGAQEVREPLTLKAEAQEVLDELWKEELLPFKLNVGKLSKDIGEYTIHFYDSRMRRASIPLTEGMSFRDMVRVAVLARVAKLSGPLKATPPAHS